MSNIMDLLAQFPVIGQAVAGAAGGIVRWATLRDNWREGVLNVIVGTLAAVYLAPVAISFYSKMSGAEISDDGGNLGAFLVGLFGMAFTGFLIDLVKIARKHHDEGGK